MRSSTHRAALEAAERAVLKIVQSENYALSPYDLADSACISRFHFGRLFTEIVGESPGSMLRRLRLERAAESLQSSNKSISEIAIDAGYLDLPAFSVAFRSAYHMSPSAFRMSRLNYRLPTGTGIHHPVEPVSLPIRVEMSAIKWISSLPLGLLAARRHFGHPWHIGVSLFALADQVGIQSSLESRIVFGSSWLGKHADKYCMAALCFSDKSTEPSQECEPWVRRWFHGAYVTTSMKGSTRGLEATWRSFETLCIDLKIKVDRIRPAFELYQFDPKLTPEQDRVTKLYLPVSS